MAVPIDVAVVAVAVLPAALVLWPMAVALVLFANRDRGHGASVAPAVAPLAILLPPLVAVVVTVALVPVLHVASFRYIKYTRRAVI